LLVAPLLAEGLLLMLYLTRAPQLDLGFDFNWRQMREFIRAGFPLALAGFIYWAYRLTGQTSVALWFSIEALAFYSFSANLVTLITRAFGDFTSVLTPILWKELSHSGSPQKLQRETSRISLFLVTATCALANLAQAGFAPLTYLILPKYTQSIPIFEVLAFNIVVLTVTIIPSLILDSAVVNRQWLHLGIWSVGLFVNFGVNFLAVRLGGGLSAIAWNDIWVQLLVVVALYAAAQPYLYPNRLTALRVYIKMGSIMLVSVVVFMALRSPSLANESPVTLASTVPTIGIRVAFALLVWGIASMVIFRRALTAAIRK